MTQPQTEMVEKMALATIAPEIEELVGALTDIRNRVLCPVGPAPTIDDLEEIASATLSKFTNTKGNDRGEG